TQAPSTSDIQPINRSHEATETKRRRLIWQTRKRGILESDILLSTFAKEELGGMTRAELEEFDKLLDEMDWDIFHWASGAKQPPPKVEQMAVFCKLREYCKNKRVVGARMPELDSQ
ncbi:Succinate dehydrogenase assembly factor 2 mitochondrial, partial [Spiromyces aspiralis]